MCECLGTMCDRIYYLSRYYAIVSRLASLAFVLSLRCWLSFARAWHHEVLCVITADTGFWWSCWVAQSQAWAAEAWSPKLFCHLVGHRAKSVRRTPPTPLHLAMCRTDSRRASRYLTRSQIQHGISINCLSERAATPADHESLLHFPST